MEVYGYVFDQPGEKYRKKFLFEGTAEKIATFILMNQWEKVCITTKYDEFICDSFPGGFINNCADMNFLEKELLPAIVPMQMGENFIPIEFLETEDVIKEI